MNKRNLIIGGVVVIICTIAYWMISHKNQDGAESMKEIIPVYGSVKNAVSSTGNIQPQNRLEIKAPIGGRIDKILVAEGQRVKVGDILAMMSSTERAALLDAARLQGADTLKQWDDVYKPTPLLAPIDGEVIVKSVNPGQTITTSDPIVVLSDRLIIQAQVDETDIGKVKLGQLAEITLDAYPEIKVNGKVDHIYYESKIVNNVTIYAVDIVPEHVPDVFRSGMSANVQIVMEQKEHVLLLPKEAVKNKNNKSFVMIRQEKGEKPTRQEVQVGISDDTNVEIVTGLTADDKVVIVPKKTASSKSSKAMSSPFMPGGSGGGRGR